MNVNIYSRINRSLNENIKLIYYSNKDYIYSFNILGTSGFVYQITIEKNFLECNCEDFKKSYFCKHICFILFKLLKLFRINKKSFEIKVPFQNTLYNTTFFNVLKFNDFEWMVFKDRYKKIKIYIKSSFFNYDNYNSFLMVYNRYLIYIKSRLCESNDKCVICLDKKDKIIKCPICNNEYHISCLVTWFKNLKNKKRCPTCTNLFWNDLYPSMLYSLKDKIGIELIKNQSNKKIEN